MVSHWLDCTRMGHCSFRGLALELDKFLEQGKELPSLAALPASVEPGNLLNRPIHAHDRDPA